MSIPDFIKETSSKIRHAVIGGEITNTIADGIEKIAGVAQDSTDTTKDIEEYIKAVELEWDSDPNKDPEVLEARGGQPRLKDRFENTDRQLAQTTDRLDGITINPMYPPIPFNAAKADANYYDAENFKYFKDEAMTIPATDNSPIFQELINYLHSKGGGTILAPSGNFAFRSQLNWESKVSLIGSNKISTIFFTEGVLFSFIAGLKGAANGSDVNKPEVWFEGCQFINFTVDNKGLSHSSPNVGGKALFILYMKKAVFRDLVLMNTIGTALGCDFLVDTVIGSIFTLNAGRNSRIAGTGFGGNSGIGIGTCALPEEPLVVSNCFTYNSGNYGIFVETQHNPTGYQSKHAKVVNCHAMGNRLGFGNKGSGGVQWMGCTAFRNLLHGFHLTQEASGDQILNCISEENGGDGIRIEESYMGDLDIVNVITNNNEGAGIAQKNNVRGGLKNLRIDNVTAHGNGGYGVGLEGNTKNVKLTNIDAVNNGKNPPVSAHTRGILLQGTHNKVSLLNSMVYDDQEEQTQRVGIDISTNTTDFILDGNNVTTYSDANAYQIKSTAGTIGTNRGLLTERYGIATIPDGQGIVEVVHAFGQIPKSIVLTPYQYSGTSYSPIWIDRRDGNMFRVRREGTSGSLDFYWSAKKI